MSQQQEFSDFEIDVNLEEVKPWGGEYQLVPPGDYALTIVHAEHKAAKSGGSTMIAVTFEVADGENKGQKVFNNYSLSPKALGRLAALTVACGAPLQGLKGSDLMGNTIMATVIHTQGQAQPDENGNLKEPKTFANVTNERPAEIEQPKVATKTAAPPITRTTQPATAQKNGAARRA